MIVAGKIVMVIDAKSAVEKQMRSPHHFIGVSSRPYTTKSRLNRSPDENRQSRAQFLKDYEERRVCSGHSLILNRCE